MKNNLTYPLSIGIASLAIVGALYAAGYLLSVRRYTVTYGPIATRAETRTVRVVHPYLMGWKSRFFGPAMNLDTKFIRRRYWSSLEIVVNPTGTNYEYACDKK